MWPNPQETVDLVTFTEEIVNGKLYFLCSGMIIYAKYERDWIWSIKWMEWTVVNGMNEIEYVNTTKMELW